MLNKADRTRRDYGPMADKADRLDMPVNHGGGAVLPSLDASRSPFLRCRKRCPVIGKDTNVGGSCTLMQVRVTGTLNGRGVHETW